MSSRPDKFVRSGRVIIGATGASVALLLGVWLLLPDRAPAPAEALTPDVEPLTAGIGAAEYDPIRREFDDTSAAGRIIAAAPLPASATVEDRIRSQADRPPPPPVDPAVMAAQATYAAALPIAMSELSEALADRRSTLRRACSKGKADSSTLYVITTFAADGKVKEHSVADDGTAPDVVACVQGQLGSLTIPPPGIEVTARATLDLR